MMMLMLPNSALANLNGTNYLGSRDEFTDTVEVFSGKLARVSSEERLYAQFNNPNTFGLYAVIGIILGLSLVFVAKAGNRAVGIVLLVMGVAAWTQTLTRSATAGAAFGGILSIFAFRRDVFTKVTLAISVISLSVIGLAFAGVLDPLVELYSRAGEDTSFSSRAMAFHSGVDVLLARPVFGAELEFEWIDGITPHQLPIFLGAMYGVLVGVAGMALLFLPPFVAIREFALTGRSSLARHPFSVVFYFTILAMALANNFAAPSLFWIAWAFGIEPLVTPRDQTEHRRPLVRRAPETDASQ
jgi:O-antigen ligase